MSNINFDLLDDLGTSPSQPREQEHTNTLDTAGSIVVPSITTSSTKLSESIDQAQHRHGTTSSDGVIESGHGLSDPFSQPELEFTRDDHATKVQTADSDGFLHGSDSNSINASSRPGTSSSEIQILLDKQNEKLTHTARLNELIQVRSDIKQSIEEVSDKIKSLKDKRQKTGINKRLKGLLKESNREFFDTHSQAEHSTGLQLAREKSTAPTSSDTTPPLDVISNGKALEDSQIKELNVLPSLNWNERIDYVRKFYPHLDIERIKSYTCYKDNDTLLRCISFTVICPLIFQLNIDIKIHSAEERIDSIILDPIQLTTLRMLSPSVTHTLVDNYARRGKVDLVMYCLNSVSILAYCRITTLYKIIKKFSWYIEDDRFTELTNTETSVTNIRLFAILKAVNNIHLILDKGGEIYHLRLFWDIVLGDTVLGNSQSVMRLSIVRQSDSHHFSNVDSLFQHLIKEFGVVDGLRTLIRNSFGINVDT